MPGLERVDQYPGHLEAQISLHLIFSCGGTLRTLCTLGMHLQDGITSTIETVTRDMIQKTWQDVELRLDVSRVTHGAHIEMY